MLGSFQVRLPWCSDQLTPKLSDKAAAIDAMRPSPVVSISSLNKLKRKHTCSPEPFAAPWTQPNKKQRLDLDQQSVASPHSTTENADLQQTLQQTSESPLPVSEPVQENNVVIPTAQSPDMSKPATPPDQQILEAELETMQRLCGLTPLQQIIDNVFNESILLKHNELRLIEQELAKCQVALEQLRRCEIRPYPGSEHPSPLVTSGLGAAVEPPAGFTRPAHPAPYGVTDGPYTRHYRHWLLHDPEFDPIPEYAAASSSDLSTPAGARSTRNHGYARKSIGKSFHTPARSIDTLHSLPNYPAPAPKDKSAPLVLKRSTDGQMVKLICNNCHRGNFSSIQGFLNHCRIAHKVDYKSHDAAAIDCGQPLDQHEAANLPVETQSAPAHKPSASRSSSSFATPAKNLVHPMNMSGNVAMPASVPQNVAFGANNGLKAVPKLAQNSSHLPSTPLNGSAQAPRLSAHFAKHNLGGNLADAIDAAKQKIDLGVEEDVSSPDVMTPDSPLVLAAGLRFAQKNSEQASRKGHKESGQRHRPSPLSASHATFILGRDNGEIPESPQDHLSNLSPHTADSNPGLVSDHEDDDHNSGSEDEAPHSAIAHSLGVRRDCSDNMDIDIAVDDDIDEHGVVIRRNSMIAGNERVLKTAGGSSKKHVGH
ncbi:Hypothetical protein R9X50_00117000 [Acrodontium crateriforme]|uniref:AHC1-like C2H2 zinc-finger domain-containing protein n=1 Tax=Acrodontium crateriforme TaxID=150365 RepID=A0AAQ3R7N5_9PEZI|nr:Hypothetical protein R9X50_00117000 [Acrodontium crateriforme]